MSQSERKLLGNEIQQEIHTFNNCFTMAISELNHNWTTERWNASCIILLMNGCGASTSSPSTYKGSASNISAITVGL